LLPRKNPIDIKTKIKISIALTKLIHTGKKAAITVGNANIAL